MSLRLSQKHGVAPFLTCCLVCGDDVGIALVGSAADRIAQERFGRPYDQCNSTHRIPDGLCKKCEKLIQEGAVAYLCASTGSSIMLSADFVKRNNLTSGVFKMKADQFAEFKKRCGNPADADNRFD